MKSKSKNHWTTTNHVKNAEENRMEQTVKTASKYQNLGRYKNNTGRAVTFFFFHSDSDLSA